MLLVDDDDPELLKRAEERRTGTHHDAGRTGAHHVPLVEALASGEARMEDRHHVTEARTETTDRLGGERDLGNEDAC